MLLLTLLAGVPVAFAHENVPGEPPVHPDLTPVQAAFDRLFWDIDDGALPLSTHEETYAALTKLEQAIPPGDVHRRLQYRYMHCLIGFIQLTTGALEYARDGVRDAHAAGDEASEAGLRLCLGSQLLVAGDLDAARLEFEQAAELARRSRDFNVQGLALVRRGNLRMDSGEMALGLQDLLDAQQVFERGNVAFQIEFNLFSIAQAYRRIGEQDKALEYVNKVLSFGQARDDEIVLATGLTERGRLYKERGQFREAEADLRRALTYSARHNHHYNLGATHMDLADVYNHAGQPQRALDEIEMALAAYRQAGSEPPTGYVDFVTGIARSRLGEHQLALPLFEPALPALLGIGDLGNALYLYRTRAASREAIGDLAGALADLREYGRLRNETTGRRTNQRVLALSHGFDARYHDLQNDRLRLEQQRTERLAAAELRRKPWRMASIGLGGVLVLLLAYLALRQTHRMLRLRRIASTDPLTGTANRRYIHRVADCAMAETAAPTCMILMDLDHFKQINDRFGHAVGDQVLVRAVAAWNTVLRRDDRLGRVGGEEFLAVLPGAGVGAGSHIAERLLEATRAMEFSDLAPGLKLTVSMGVTHVGSPDGTLKDVLERADAALYRAKANGRDRIEIAVKMHPGAVQ